MIVHDLTGFLEAVDGAIAQGAQGVALFAGAEVITTLAKVPVARDPRSLLPQPATMLGGLPVYLHPMLQPQAIMFLAGADVTQTLQAIAHADAVTERSACWQPQPKNFS